MAFSSFSISSLICCCVIGVCGIAAGACAQTAAVTHRAAASGAAARPSILIIGVLLDERIRADNARRREYSGLAGDAAVRIACRGGPRRPGWTIHINPCRFIDMETAPLLRLLGDEARLRLLRLLQAEQLNVSELTGILGIAQSGVSRHLGLLKDAGLVE